MSTSAIIEIVLEADSRLMSKQDCDKFADQPIQSFKQHILQILPNLESTATYYGRRTSKRPGAPKGEHQIQCIVKAPLAARQTILEFSGQTHLLSRDFLDHQQTPQVTTVLPRFWLTNPQERKRAHRDKGN